MMVNLKGSPSRRPAGLRGEEVESVPVGGGMSQMPEDFKHGRVVVMVFDSLIRGVNQHAAQSVESLAGRDTASEGLAYYLLHVYRDHRVNKATKHCGLRVVQAQRIAVIEHRSKPQSRCQECADHRVKGAML
jgi:hypothetical protein